MPGPARRRCPTRPGGLVRDQGLVWLRAETGNHRHDGSALARKESVGTQLKSRARSPPRPASHWRPRRFQLPRSRPARHGPAAEARRTEAATHRHDHDESPARHEAEGTGRQIATTSAGPSEAARVAGGWTKRTAREAPVRSSSPQGTSRTAPAHTQTRERPLTPSQSGRSPAVRDLDREPIRPTSRPSPSTKTVPSISGASANVRPAQTPSSHARSSISTVEFVADQRIAELERDLLLHGHQVRRGGRSFTSSGRWPSSFAPACPAPANT